VADNAHQPQDPRGIANAILQVARAQGKQLTLMQLIKLVYLAHGWSWAILHRPLSKAPVQAWQYGPVYPEVYSAFKRFGSSPISSLAVSKSTGQTYQADLDEDDRDLIGAVVDAYGGMHAFQLSNIMHQPGTPWTETFNSSGAYSVIPEELIRKHYDELQRERSTQT
jgi:uncharacterized phage-associated protein